MQMLLWIDMWHWSIIYISIIWFKVCYVKHRSPVMTVANCMKCMAYTDPIRRNVTFLFKTWFPSSVSVTCAQILGMQKQPKYVMITASPSHSPVTAHLHCTCALNVLMKFTVNIPIKCFLIFCILCSRCPWPVKTRLVCCYIWYSFLVVLLDERCTRTQTHTHTHITVISILCNFAQRCPCECAFRSKLLNICWKANHWSKRAGRHRDHCLHMWQISKV